MGLEIPKAAGASLDLALAAAIRESPPARWIPARNRHLTLVFLGSIEESMLGGLGKALKPVFEAGRPLTLSFRGGGVFPAGKPARVVWVGLGPSGPLTRLYRDTAAACADLGFPTERRPFVPHLTLARCRPPWPAPAGASWIRRSSRCLAAAGGPVSFEVGRAVLFESLPEAGGVRYRVVQSYPLGREAPVS